MFTAVIIACHVAYAEMCMTIIDNRGPYKTEELCKNRIGEMTNDLMGLWLSTRTPMVFKITSCIMDEEETKKEIAT